MPAGNATGLALVAAENKGPPKIDPDCVCDVGFETHTGAPELSTEPAGSGELKSPLPELHIEQADEAEGLDLLFNTMP